MVKISDRLKTAASLIREGAVLADVGTDHGYVPIYLLEQKKIKPLSAIPFYILRGVRIVILKSMRVYHWKKKIDYFRGKNNDPIHKIIPMAVHIRHYLIGDIC